jgi:hypothetical protein
MALLLDEGERYRMSSRLIAAVALILGGVILV